MSVISGHATKPVSTDNLHVRLNFLSRLKKVNSRKELIKISKIAKFGCEML